MSQKDLLKERVEHLNPKVALCHTAYATLCKKPGQGGKAEVGLRRVPGRRK